MVIVLIDTVVSDFIAKIIIVLIAMYFGVDPTTFLNVGQELSQPNAESSAPIPADDEMANFVAKVLGSTEDTWQKIFQTSGYNYPAPKLITFSFK